jgi:hypothetical protein
MFGDSTGMYTSATNRDAATCNTNTATNNIADCDKIAVWSDDNVTKVTMDSWNNLGMRLTGGAPCLSMTKGADPEGAMTDMSCDTTHHSVCEFTCATGQFRQTRIANDAYPVPTRENV